MYNVLQCDCFMYRDFFSIDHQKKEGRSAAQVKYVVDENEVYI